MPACRRLDASMRIRYISCLGISLWAVQEHHLIHSREGRLSETKLLVFLCKQKTAYEIVCPLEVSGTALRHREGDQHIGLQCCSLLGRSALNVPA